MLNLLDDLSEEKADLLQTHHATLNILNDFDEERNLLSAGMSAVFNILDDFRGDNILLRSGQSAMVNILEDLDEAKAKAEAAGAQLAQANSHRAQIAEAHATELKRINEGLQIASKELETFSYSVSHDLRAPLRAIDGFSRIVLEDYGAVLPAEGQRVLRVVCESAAKMSAMIDDILTFARVGRIEIALTPIDMSAMVNDLLAGPLARPCVGRALTFDIEPLPRIQGDAKLLQHVWLNLIENAIKFTASKTAARIAIGATAAAHEIVYHVRDNGAGFDMQYTDKLFGVFQRLHGAEFPGTGIGLAIVRRIVGRHGGRVWAEGKIGKGATFYFALPARPGVQ